MLQLKKFLDIPVSTLKEARGSRPHPEEPSFRLVARDEGSFPSLVWKEFRAFPSHLMMRRSPQERREELQGHPTIPSPPDVSVHSRGTCFQCTASTFTPRFDTRHGGTWQYPVGKPRGKHRGKDSRENHRSFDPRGGLRDTAATALEESASACPHSRRRTDSPGETPEVPQDPCQHWRGILRFRP